jgi:hypothetical protein
VPFDGLLRDVQPRGDLAVGETLADQRRDLTLTAGQAGVPGLADSRPRAGHLGDGAPRTAVGHGLAGRPELRVRLVDGAAVGQDGAGERASPRGVEPEVGLVQGVGRRQGGRRRVPVVGGTAGEHLRLGEQRQAVPSAQAQYLGLRVCPGRVLLGQLQPLGPQRRAREHLVPRDPGRHAHHRQLGATQRGDVGQARHGVPAVEPGLRQQLLEHQRIPVGGGRRAQRQRLGAVHRVPVDAVGPHRDAARQGDGVRAQVGPLDRQRGGVPRGLDGPVQVTRRTQGEEPPRLQVEEDVGRRAE